MRFTALVVLLSALPLAGSASAAAPTVASLDPAAGPPHTLVTIQGANLGLGAVVWDAGTPAATDIPGGYLGAFMFSVPPTAVPGVHNVAVRTSSGQSTVKQFTVTAAVASFPRPRIDSITLTGASFDASGHVTASLYVQGANLDVGAVVLIGGVQVATSAHKAMRNDLYGVAPTELGYPISHFLSTIAVPGSRAAGATLAISVRNLDTRTSDVVQYTLPKNAATMDSDGDGLLDIWETKGYDADGDGVVDVNLPALGTDPYRRDILVEVDVMPAATATQSGLQYPPGAATFNAVRAMFSAAPFLNPTGASGINLILDTSGSVPYVALVCFDLGTASGCADNPSLGVLKYSTIKAHRFDNVHRDKIFHYAVWGAAKNGGEPSRSDRADDFVIAFDAWGTAASDHPAFVQSVRAQVEEFAHELGHDLGLHHGGVADDFDYKANHWSVMSYTWDTRVGFDNQFRLDHATCSPFYYKIARANESSQGAPPANPGTAVDYSSGMGRKLVTNTATVVCGKTVNWAKDGTSGIIADSADWPILRFDGPVQNGLLTP